MLQSSFQKDTEKKSKVCGFLYLNEKFIFSFSISEGCQECWDDIVKAVGDCLLIGVDGWKPCVEDVLGAANPCIDCVCQVIGDVCNVFGCDFSC